MKSNLKKVVSVFLLLAFMFSAFACTQQSAEPGKQPEVAPETPAAESKYTPGTYTGTGRGNGGNIEVAVTFSADAITGIEIVAHNETPGIFDVPFERIPNAVIEGQTLNVDIVSGATYSSGGLIEAITDAVVQAGGNPDEMLQSSGGSAKAADETYTADVIVVGAGGAGLAAAVSAHENGASVIVIEKMPKVGGNTIISGAAYNSSDSERQAKLDAGAGPEATINNLINATSANDEHKALQEELAKEYKAYKDAGSKGLFDSPTLHALQTYEGGDRVGELMHIKKLTFNTLDALHWIEGLGMEFTEDIFTVLGALWPRSHRPVKPLGTGYIETLHEYCINNGITILLDTTANALIEKDGAVTGVEATGLSGNKITLNANKSVVLATGGFGKNVEMREEYNKLSPNAWSTLDAAIPSTNHPGATGDGLIMATSIGAALTGMEYIQLLPMGDPETGSLAGNIEQGVEDRFFVNKNGDRFVAEDARRDVMTSALYAQPDAYMWVIVDKHSYPTGDKKNNFNETIDFLVSEGRAFKADTIEDLAKQIGVPADNLQKAVDSFNAGVDKGSDEFGRSLFANKIDTAPYYAGARVPTVHHTMGGLKVTENNEVLKENGEVIKGLYAAGEVTGGTHGSNRLGGNALADTMVNGRIAGKQASK